MKILDMEQCSPEWFEAKRGIPSSSEFSKIITTDGKQSKQREKYMWKLAGETLGGSLEEGYQSFAMAKGKEKEQEAKILFEMVHEPIRSVGFILADDGKCGSSTDGLIGDKGVFELKCPEITAHIGYLLHPEEIPTDYYQQTQGELFVTGREYIHFMSYYPGLSPLFIREEPDEVFQRLLKKELDLFWDELQAIVKKLSI